MITYILIDSVARCIPYPMVPYMAQPLCPRGRKVGSTCKFRCQHGSELKGAKQATCDLNAIGIPNWTFADFLWRFAKKLILNMTYQTFTLTYINACFSDAMQQAVPSTEWGSYRLGLDVRRNNPGCLQHRIWHERTQHVLLRARRPFVESSK